MTTLRSYPEPRLSQLLFASKPAAVFWTVVRVYLGWLWLQAGWGKVTSPNWVGADAGTALSGYLQGALGRAAAETPTVPGWYAWMIETIFLPNATVMSYLVAFGQVAVGVALIVGCLVGVAAFFGGFMNVSFLLAGTLSTNPVMFVLATWLVLAWRVAGYYGLDYWVLPKLGAPRGKFGSEGRGANGVREPEVAKQH
jgi:thiosulfate dehydrogenase [quinone] large subunit